MIIYIDITMLDRGRLNTGIQRVVTEFLKRAVGTPAGIDYKIISYNSQLKSMEILDNQEIKIFVDNVKKYQFKNKQALDIETLKVPKNTLFFDMDSVWNAPLKRAALYPKLKHNGFLIFNLLYDLVPVVKPQYAHAQTVSNFKPFLKAIYQHSNLAFFDSLSANNDFIEQKKETNTNYIPTRVVGLGSDFIKNKEPLIDQKLNKLTNKKYILFVGTIEPRKSQLSMLNAFDILAEKDPDLNLIFIGKQGWNVDGFIKVLNNHPLKDKRLFWLNNINDQQLNHFYQNAFIVTYLSEYEGYGLPIAESLQLGNITIASKNSSMYEVGRDFADYIEYNTQNELVDIITLYTENNALYTAKKQHIKKHYKTISWDMFYQSVSDVFTGFEKSQTIKQNHLKTLQFVFISIDLDSLQGTIRAIDKYIDFVKEYIIITAPNLVKKAQKISSKHKITVIDETNILGQYAKDFAQRDHVSKNWLLRTSLLNVTALDHEFIMLDDDNRPLKPLSLELFIDSQGRYKSYYFYNLLEWNHKATEYDIGQQNMKRILSDENYELLAYSSHAPQIINKQIFKEVVDKFFEIGLKTSIDEWSIYFNYASSRYPDLYNKNIFRTLNWPDNPFHWEHIYQPQDIAFENYYKDVYITGLFNEKNSTAEKLQIKNQQIAPFIKSRDFFKQNKRLLAENNMVHGYCMFQHEDIELYLANIPYFLIVNKDADIRLKTNYKIFNPSKNPVAISLTVQVNNIDRTHRKISQLNDNVYQESIIELPIVTSRLQNGYYNVTIDAKINGKRIYKNNSPYLMRLIVNEDNTFKLKNIALKTFATNMKKIIIATPIIGMLALWGKKKLRTISKKTKTIGLDQSTRK